MNTQAPITISVIILNWNNWQDTLNAIQRLRQAEAENISLDVIVVDNGSTDESIAQLRQQLDIKLFELNENKGFAAANNVGIRYALEQNCDYLLPLNNDAFVSTDFLEPLLARFQQDVHIGIVSPKIYYHDPTVEFSEASLQENRVIWYAGGKFRQPRLLGEMMGMDTLDQGQYDRPQIVDFAVGCCMLIRRSLFEQIGLFDERFFFYQEDVDLSYRATKAGLTVWYEPASQVWHQASRSTEGNLPHRTFLYSKSRVIFFAKHIRGIKWIPVLGLEFIRLIRMILKQLIARQPRQASSYIRGIIEGWAFVIQMALNKKE